MHLVKRKAFVFLLFLGCMLLAGCGFMDDSESKETIFQYVTEHSESLRAFPYPPFITWRSDEKKEEYIKDRLGEDTIVKGVYRYSPDILDFYCGGTGIVSASTYSGFYYSEKDIPNALAFESEAQFTQTGDGVYGWESEDGQRECIAERIQPNWFYYFLRWN